MGGRVVGVEGLKGVQVSGQCCGGWGFGSGDLFRGKTPPPSFKGLDNRVKTRHLLVVLLPAPSSIKGFKHGSIPRAFLRKIQHSTPGSLSSCMSSGNQLMLRILMMPVRAAAVIADVETLLLVACEAIAMKYSMWSYYMVRIAYIIQS